MIGKLEFNLPEEKEEFLAAQNGMKYKCQIDELYDRVFRPHIKYEKQLTPNVDRSDELEVTQAIWDKVKEHFEDQ
jgi:hypothetical protein